MQGMQVFTGTHDAWGGFASRYLERVRDEYGKFPVWVWGIEEVEQKQAVRTHCQLRHLKYLESRVDSDKN